MSNYPPGVTGREPEIAGYPERTEKVECRSTTTAFYRREVLDVLAEVRRTCANTDQIGVVAHFREKLEGLTETPELDCEWEGEVEGWPNGDDFEWTCPRCGNEQVEEGLYEPDPDLQWERRYD